STSGGTTFALTGTGLGGASRVLVDGVEAVFQITTDQELIVTAPPHASAGPVDLVVHDQGGPRGELPAGLLYLDPLQGASVSLSPDHGPVEGGTRVALGLGGRRAIAPGTRVLIGGVDAVDVDVETLGTLHFTTPRVEQATLAPVSLVRPGEPPQVVGIFSYDLPTGTTIDLPGFPPRVASEIRLQGDTLYAGVATTQYPGLEIFDVQIEERAIRLGGLSTEGPVRGLDVSGALAALAEDAFGLRLVDVSRPEAPYTVARGLTLGKATGVRLEGRVAYVSVTDPGSGVGYVQSFDVGLPLAPELAAVPLDADALALDLGPDRFYALTSQVSAGSGPGLFLSIYDRQGARLGRATVWAGALSYESLVKSRLAVRAGRAYVTVGKKLYVFDISDEAAPVALQATELPDDASGLTFAGGSLFVATSGTSTVVEVPPTDLLVVDTEPADGALAPATALVQTRFTMPVTPDSVTEQSYEVAVRQGSSWIPWPGSREVVFAVRGATIVFTPDVPFPPGQAVRVRATTGLRAFDARPLAAAFEATFTVAPDEGAVQPRISGIAPSSGLATQHTTVLITGGGFRSGTSVRVGGLDAQVLQATDSVLEVMVPPSLGGAPGPAAVEVLDPSGLVAQRLGGFVYREALRILSLSPARAPQQGGVEVSVQGRGFMPGLTVTFGATASFTVRVLSPELATAVAPPGDAGLVDVSVGLLGQSAALPRSFLYGSGAVAELPTPPISHVLVEGGVAYAALGGETPIVGVDGTVYEANRQTAGGGLLIADLGEPTNVRQIARIDTSGAGGARRVVKVGSTVYLAAGAAGLKVIDVTLPAQPTVVATLAVQGNCRDVAAASGVVFAADDQGIAVFRLGETPQPLPVGRKAIAGGVSALALHQGLLLASSADATAPALHVLDARRGDLPALGTIALAAPARHLAAYGTRAFASLGQARQVAVVELADPTAPAPAGTLVLVDPQDRTWMSAEQTVVASGIAYVAAGGGKVQRFAVPVGEPPRLLERAVVFGDAKTVAFLGRYLLAGTLALDVQGRKVELPLELPDDRVGVLAGALASVALDHLELRGTTPSEGELVPVTTRIRAHLTELPDIRTAGTVTLSPVGGSAPVPVLRRVESTPEGGDLILEPLSVLAPATQYVLRIGAGLASLAGGTLGTEVAVRFTTASTASQERPQLSDVSPAFALEAGGTISVLHGQGFLPGVAVKFGGAPATVLVVSEDGREIQVVVPPGQAGLAAVEIENVGGLSELSPGAFRYLGLPAIASLQPTSAAFDSRTRIILTGEGLYGGSQVTFANRPARAVELQSDGRLSVEVPDDVTGPVDVRVATPAAGGSVVATAPNGFTFTL
ncbi:MAG TPA: IPT/TIG domain-containing protein, partial [Myxococcales bacterium]|nr:IPT/TIG domain-containing protein [Myxococcales bacterium]